MRKSILLPLLSVLLLSPGTATAAPTPTPSPAVRDFGNGPDRNDEAALIPEQFAAKAAETAIPAFDHNRGYPRHTALPIPPENPADASIKLGLIPHHAIAARLNDLQARSDRVSAEIIGRSAGGRDLYLVTVTAPETAAQAREQERLRQRIESGHQIPANRYKAPIYVNANIHGNEWEGTDAALRVIEELATDPAAGDLLKTTRLYFNVTANPDGRVGNKRANDNGFDLNRDFVTASQPEDRAMRQIMIDTQPVTMIDLHGYVNGTLVEPTTPPHGANYEYDLFIRNAYPNGLGIEAAINGLGYTPDKDGVFPVQIPFRDLDEGWDDWPPIFTPQYAPFHGAVAAHTIEFPMQVNNAAYNTLPVEELRRRAQINVNIASAAIHATYSFVKANHDRLIGDQTEVFRRGAAGEPSRVVPLGSVPGFGPEDQWNTTFPRAYTIAAGSPAAARLVDHLIANDVKVGRAVLPFRSGGRTYPAGTYVVDMHQPKRGLANVMLEPGQDISPRVNAMYDISGWSHALLWGATVQPLSDYRVVAEPVRVAAPTGFVPPGHGALALQLTDENDVIALNALLGRGVQVTWTANGRAVLPDSARPAARELADRYGVRFSRSGTAAGAALAPVRVTAAASADDLFTLREMGFSVTPVSTAVLNAGYDWSATDVLFVSSGLNYGALNPAAKAALEAYLTGGGVVTRGATGAAFNAATALLPVTAVAGRSDANGVVRLTSGDYSFVYSPRWFTGLGAGVRAEQTYDSFVSGHWRPNEDGTGGQDAAKGQAAVVSGRSARGAAAVLFGTEPMFRNHPKALFPQVAQALYWTAGTSGASR
ncbi:M14 family zinc carboxypeptidase [Nonomuraea sp. NPDC050536]|uniref:M14 family zinc carboxypeptidase n=1 Tax=Nonomuraea sp. NPDC050536 TaxID=3364366 RepID=UPI0037C60308